MKLAEELAEIAGKVAGLKGQMDQITRRQLNHQGDHSAQSRELGQLHGECLSLRLAMLYKIESNWGTVLAALRAFDDISREAAPHK